MVVSGYPIIVIPLIGGGEVDLPISRMSVGDTGVIFNLPGGDKTHVKLRKLYKGESVVIVNVNGGGKLAIPLIETPSIDFTYRVNFGSGGDFLGGLTLTVDGEWNQTTAFYGLPSENYPWDFKYIEFTAKIGVNIATCRCIGQERDFTNPMRAEQVLTFHTTSIDGACYVDGVQFWNYATNETYDLNGNGGFETGGTMWSLTGDAIITDTQYYEGSHSLKLL